MIDNIPSKPFLHIFQIMMYPVGKREVIPMILPDAISVRIDVVKSVEALTVAPNRLAEVKLQLLKTDPDKFVPTKSREVISSE